MKQGRLGFRLAILIGVLLAGCNRTQALPSTVPAVPVAWIDAPLNGVTLPLASYPVVYHAADPGGVIGAEWSVDGVILASDANPDPSALLVTFQHPWSPQAPGEYTHRVRTQGTGGAWGEYAEAVVTIGDGTPTDTPTPATITPTITPTPTATPTPAAGFSLPTLSSTGFYYGPASCDPMQVTLRVRVTDLRGVKVVVFFERLKDTASGETTEWSDGASMNPLADGEFQITLAGNAVGSSSGFAEATVLYQFVAQLNDGTYLRSPVYADLTLGKCGTVLLPMILNPRRLPTTPAPPIIK
jgi:hypothetical protein